MLGISDVRRIQVQLMSRLTYGANDEAKFEEFIVVEGARSSVVLGGRRRPFRLI